MRRTTSKRFLSVVALVLLGTAIPLVVIAVSEHHFFEVEHKGEQEFSATMDIALGNVSIGLADDDYLFQAEVQLESEKLVPNFDYKVDGTKGRLNVDLTTVKDKKDAVSLPDLGKVKETQWDLYFGRKVPVDLKMQLAGTSSDLDFTGIPLSRLRLEVQASKSSIRFDHPNPAAMNYLSVESGASELDAFGLANARASHMVFKGGMGKFKLDFGGDRPMRPGAEADIEIGMASLDITLPASGPVILYVPDSWFCRVDVPNGYIKRDKGVYVSPDYRTDADAFSVKVNAGVGKVNFATR